MTNFKEIIERLERLPWQSELIDGYWVFSVRHPDSVYELPHLVLYSNCLMLLGLGGRLQPCDMLEEWARGYYCTLLRKDDTLLDAEDLEPLLFILDQLEK